MNEDTRGEKKKSNRIFFSLHWLCCYSKENRFDDWSMLW